MKYWINTIDSETTPSWFDFCLSVEVGAQDSGRCAFRAVVEENQEAFEAALEGDDAVLSYEIEQPE